MSAKHISDGRQRRSAKYKAIHADLAAYVALKRIEPKAKRKRAKSEHFRRCGE